MQSIRLTRKGKRLCLVFEINAYKISTFEWHE
jgi:hypothetical protein